MKSISYSKKITYNPYVSFHCFNITNNSNSYSKVNKTREKLLIQINNECIKQIRNNKNQLKLNHKTPKQIEEEITYEKYVHLGIKIEKFTPNDLNHRGLGSSHNYHSHTCFKINPFTNMSDEQISPPNFSRQSLGRKKINRFSKLLLNNASLFKKIADNNKNNSCNDDNSEDSKVSSSLSSLSEESSSMNEIETPKEKEEKRDYKLHKQAFNYLQMVVRHIKRNKKNSHIIENANKFNFEMSPINKHKTLKM